MGLLRREGLFDVHCPHQDVACPSVFSPTKWIARKLTCHELLRVFDIPLSMDEAFRTRQTQDMVYTRPSNLACAITPLVVTAIFRDLWGIKGGLMNGLSYALGQTMSQSTIKAGDVLGKDNSDNKEKENSEDKMPREDNEAEDRHSQLARQLGSQSPIQPSDVESLATRKLGSQSSIQSSVVEAMCFDQSSIPSSDGSVSSEDSPLPALIIGGGDSSSDETSRNSHVGLPSHGWDLETYESFLPGKFIHIDFTHIKGLMSPPEKDDLSSCSFSSAEEGNSEPLSESSARFTTAPTQARLDHIKEDAPVPMHVWDRKVFHGPPTPIQAKALAVAREGLLRHY